MAWDYYFCIASSFALLTHHCNTAIVNPKSSDRLYIQTFLPQISKTTVVVSGIQNDLPFSTQVTNQIPFSISVCGHAAHFRSARAKNGTRARFLNGRRKPEPARPVGVWPATWPPAIRASLVCLSPSPCRQRGQVCPRRVAALPSVRFLPSAGRRRGYWLRPCSECSSLRCTARRL